MASTKHRRVSAKTKKLAVEIGAGAALAASAAAAAYFLYGRAAPKTKRAVRGWILAAKKEVAAELKKLPSVNRTTYGKAIETVAKRYRALKHIQGKEIEMMVRDFKRYWPMIQKAIAKPPKKKKT